MELRAYFLRVTSGSYRYISTSVGETNGTDAYRRSQYWKLARECSVRYLSVGISNKFRVPALVGCEL